MRKYEHGTRFDKRVTTYELNLDREKTDRGQGEIRKVMTENLGMRRIFLKMVPTI